MTSYKRKTVVRHHPAKRNDQERSHDDMTLLDCCSESRKQVALSWKTTPDESLLKRESPNLTKCELHGCKYFPAERHRSCCRRARLSWQPTNKLGQLVLNTSLVCHPDFKFSTYSVSRDCAVEVSSTNVTGVTCERSMSANPCRNTTHESPMRSISGCRSTSTVTRVVKQQPSRSQVRMFEH